MAASGLLTLRSMEAKVAVRAVVSMHTQSQNTVKVPPLNWSYWLAGL